MTSEVRTAHLRRDRRCTHEDAEEDVEEAGKNSLKIGIETWHDEEYAT